MIDAAQAMKHQGNSIPIAHLQRADVTVGDLRAIIAVLDALAAPFVLPSDVAQALDRLRKKLD
jgi:hypothetical protein